MSSIGRQLGLGLVAILLLTVVLVGQGSVWLFDQALRDYLARSLQVETDSLLAAITPGPEGLYLDRARVDPDYDRPYSGRYFVIDAGERWRSRSLWDARLPLDADGLHNTLVAGPDDQQLLVWSGRYEVSGQAVDISVATDYLPLLRAFDQARWAIWALGLLTIGVALLVQRWVLNRAFQPLRRIRRELAEWHVGKRLELGSDVPEELEPLVSEINHLGRQIEQIIQRSRGGQADLGHALKTPLAVATALLQQATADPGSDTLAGIGVQLTAIRNQMDRALQRARLAPESQASQRFSAAEDLPWLLDSLRSIHGNDLQLETRLGEAAQAEWPFEREDMLELLGNLLDNACKWARRTVVLSADMNSEGLVLRIADDGPGVAEHERSAILRRGHRLDQSAEGDGIGLAIVTDLVEVYQGRLELQESSLGGLEVDVLLPVTRRQQRSDA
ncbi:ATP-binding protein [Halopseudomonas salina]|uniref:histidine kinase n=1 Tax=Halopseudomonas salina TaxID=1323744 RepID=A0ABQ1PGM1_9GAMM|nr:ATP-binding protein [Halopseudomonas salina]GGC96810.1 two-component sensor [Halopseudomonas salina]